MLVLLIELDAKGEGLKNHDIKEQWIKLVILREVHKLS